MSENLPSDDSLNEAPGYSETNEQRRRELADFLRTRREKLKPEQVGLTQGSRRRTPGLRREEVAELAGVGTTWYTWLEQARDIQPSTEVLARLGQALQLNAAEVRHMFVLAGKAPPTETDSGVEVVTASMHRLLNEAIRVPAIILGARWDVLEMNVPAATAFGPLDDIPLSTRNWVYYMFCHPRSRAIVVSWEMNARRLLAEFRSSLGDSLDNPWVLELVERLKKDSPEFSAWWREHDVRETSPALVEIDDPERGGKRVFERSILRPWENMRYKVLIFTPVNS